MTNKERKELEREVQRMYFACLNQERWLKTHGELTDFLDVCIMKASGSHLEDLLKVKKLAQDVNAYACDAFSDLQDGDVWSAFWRACKDSPEARRVRFVQRQMERLGE